MAGTVPMAAARTKSPVSPAATESSFVKWFLIVAAGLVLLWLIVLPLTIVLTEALKKAGMYILRHYQIRMPCPR
ncbi:hypothetical protein JCM16418_3582 [Paenibacillus pini JCM 16418]|uniref:Uncharacterized protein n=1 Tax=Paenibacillus pini JCM 16418 TaxID=1236976 RepID=W7YXN5_9BACL|nr:hypothetical protein JCM16418_3582 [Paenibacillus pini JCM 16418]